MTINAYCKSNGILNNYRYVQLSTLAVSCQGHIFQITLKLERKIGTDSITQKNNYFAVKDYVNQL